MEEQPSVIQVFLLDDHEIVRRGVRELLEAEPDTITTALELEMPVGDPTKAFPFVLAKQGEISFFDRILPSADLRMSDRAFDDTFVIRAMDPHATRAVLSTEGVTAAFVWLACHAPRFSMDPRSISLGWRGPLEAAASVDAVLGCSRTIADAFASRLGAGSGPYR